MTLHDLILTALFSAKECPDSPEPGRACRHCEATAVRDALARAVVKAVAR